MDVRFDSRDAGTPEHAWTPQWRASLSALACPAPGDRLLVVAAHPDDETLGAGGLIATAAAVNAAVTVLIASDGEASHPDSPTRSPAQLAELRRREVTDAVAQLHPNAELHFLGLPDSALSDHTVELTQHVWRHAENASLLVTPWTGDRHPDHAACADVGSRIARAIGIDHWQFPIWAWHWGVPQSPELPPAQLRRLDLDDTVVAAKHRALAAHVSQHTALSAEPGDEAILNESMLAHFRRTCEVFVVSHPASATSAAYFNDLYAQCSDPWGLADRLYERRKRDLLLASLPRERFLRAFEPGCAIGLLTVQLSHRCDEVIAWDGAQAAVDQTTARVGASAAGTDVHVELGRIPTDWPTGQFDLIVVSEVGYFCPDQQQLADRINESLSADGVLIACHWRHRAPDHPVTGDDVHTALGRGRHRIVAHREADFLLDVWTRDGASVANAEGII